jgi:ribonuclease-3 family protein
MSSPLLPPHLEPASLLPEPMVRSLSPTLLAHLGDVVFELLVRSHCLLPPRRIQDYHGQVVSLVRAERQSALLRQIQPLLTEDEQDWVRRGRNASSDGPRRIDSNLYRDASALETLLGYLYLRDPQRLRELLGILASCFSDSPKD